MFDFDQLGEIYGDREGEHQAFAEAALQDAEPAEFLGDSRTATALVDEIQFGTGGLPRGFCLCCHACLGWAPSSSSRAPPQGPDPAIEGWANAGFEPAPIEARGHVLPSLGRGMPTFDGRRFRWPETPPPAGPPAGVLPRGSGAPCARCGCPESEHECVQARLGRFLEQCEQIPLAALRWSNTELALWGDTGGVFRPEARRHYEPAGQRPGVLVSAVCPTTASRSCFHPLVWHCFTKQEHEPRELVVVDTGEEPSAFFVEKARSDKRLLYLHYAVPEKEWCIGLKRNLACYYASGKVIAHFDDDDMYAPCYLAVMLKCLRDPAEPFKLRLNSNSSNQNELLEMYHALNMKDTEHGPQHWPDLPGKAHFWKDAVLQGAYGAAIAKLCSWFSYSLQDRAWVHCDATDGETLTKDTRQEIYGWGFSLVYLRSAWQASPFLHIGLGEDLDFVQSLRELYLPMALVPDRRGICAHTQHMLNITGTCLKFGGRGITPSLLLYSPLASVMGWYEIAAKGMTDHQQSLKDGTAGKGGPVLIMPTEGRVSAKTDGSKIRPSQKLNLPMPLWFGQRTKEQVVAMQDELIYALIEESFQQRLHNSWHEDAANPRKQEVHRRNICLERQGPVLERFGFENSLKGLFQCVTDCIGVSRDEEVMLKDNLLQWLTHPGNKAWQVLWPRLADFIVDLSIGAIRENVSNIWYELETLQNVSA